MHIHRLGRCAVLAAALFLPSATVAQDATAADRSVIQQCLKARAAASEERERCVGAIADPCLDKGEDPSTYGMAECSKREYLVWDERLNTAYKKLMAELETGQRAQLQDMQRAWIAFSERKCGFYGVIQEGTIVIPISSYCAMQETGRQALFLEQMLDEGDSR
jgi:uncharacterized protein YecT (DUF1311 family)